MNLSMTPGPSVILIIFLSNNIKVIMAIVREYRQRENTIKCAYKLAFNDQLEVSIRSR